MYFHVNRIFNYKLGSSRYSRLQKLKSSHTFFFSPCLGYSTGFTGNTEVSTRSRASKCTGRDLFFKLYYGYVKSLLFIVTHRHVARIYFWGVQTWLLPLFFFDIWIFSEKLKFRGGEFRPRELPWLRASVLNLRRKIGIFASTHT